MKNQFEPVNIYSFSCRIRIRIPNWTKTDPKPDFDQLKKNYESYKQLTFIDFYKGGGGIGWRPFQSAALRGGGDIPLLGGSWATPQGPQNHLRLSFLSGAFDPQEIVQRSQSYEGFMPTFNQHGSLGYAIPLGISRFPENRHSGT